MDGTRKIVHRAYARVCVFLFTIDRANRLTNDHTPVVAGILTRSTRVCVFCERPILGA